MEGRLAHASNLALRVRVGPERIPAIYKPIRGERELWDFPEGCLAGRELSTYLIASSGGWGHVPPTVLRDGPLGQGSVQQWVGPLDVAEPPDLVRVDAIEDLPEGNLPIISVETEDGPGVVSHADEPELASLAVLDAVINNTDRKASHLIVADDRLYAIDHGVTCHAEPKLRTVLWGWAGDPLPEEDLARLHRLLAALDDGLDERLEPLLTDLERAAVRGRTERLVRTGVFPAPGAGTYPLPWPLW